MAIHEAFDNVNQIPLCARRSVSLVLNSLSLVSLVSVVRPLDASIPLFVHEGVGFRVEGQGLVFSVYSLGCRV